MIAQNDDPELLEWLANADREGGNFVSSIARAGLIADHQNYPLLRPVLLQMRAKYPKYEASEPVKQQIRERAKGLDALIPDGTCPRCGHKHEGERECGVSMGGGGLCRCELSVPV